MEVIYTGLRQTPEQIVAAALQEDADVIGLSILSGAHNSICPRLMDLLREKRLNDVLVVLGGIIPDADLPALKAMGVAAVFRPGTSMQEIIDFITRAGLDAGASPGAKAAGASADKHHDWFDCRWRISFSWPTTASRFSASSN